MPQISDDSLFADGTEEEAGQLFCFQTRMRGTRMRVPPSTVINDLNPVTKLTKPVCLTNLTCAF